MEDAGEEAEVEEDCDRLKPGRHGDGEGEVGPASRLVDRLFADQDEQHKDGYRDPQVQDHSVDQGRALDVVHDHKLKLHTVLIEI